MAEIKPFQAVRPEPEVAHLVASVPYDVVNRKEAAELAEGNPLSFLRVTRAEIELDSETNAYSDFVYEKARANWERLQEEAPMVQDETPHFYVYKIVWKEQEQVGIAATFSVDEYENDVIKKHEKTRKVKEDDRTNHILATEAQTGAVFLTYNGTDDIDKIVDASMEANQPFYDFTANDGVRHLVWQVREALHAKLITGMANVPNLYIADGHHRIASASRARQTKKHENPRHNGTEDYNYFIGVLFPAKQVNILPYNRVIFDLPDNLKSNFFDRIQENFTLEETDATSPTAERTFCMYYNQQWYLLKPRDSVRPDDSVGANLDVSVLHNYLIAPIFGIHDLRTDENIDYIGGIRGTDELERLVDSGRAEVAFSLNPVSVEDLIRISDADEIMPPKSTWFEPKLRDGLLVHTI